jgi:hypothetical protein
MKIYSNQKESITKKKSKNVWIIFKETIAK